MTLEQFLESLPEFAVDMKLNTKTLLETTILTTKQAQLVFYGCAFGTKNKQLFDMFHNQFSSNLTEEEMNGAKIAATIMSMTNIYYRFTHLTKAEEYLKMPPNLRMNNMAPAKHGMDQTDFEHVSFAVSVLNGCSGCIDSHERNLKKHGQTSAQVQESAKIAAVVHALAVILSNS